MAAVAEPSSIAASATPSSASTSRLEPLLILARSTKPRGAAAANLVQQAVSAPGAYFLGELFDVPGVSELSTSTDDLHTAYQLLCLFAYGTYGDYLHLLQSGAVPELSRDQIFKLRQLTLLSLARQQKALSYSTLYHSLGMTNSRELEDLIIETIYAGLASGKLNELQQRFEVHHIQGRDVIQPAMSSQPAITALPSLASTPTSQVESMLSALQSWQLTAASVLESLQARMQATRANADEAEHKRQQHHQALLQNLTEAQHHLDAQQQQAQRKGKAAATAMEIDDDNPRVAARKKSALAGVRGSKRSRA